MKTWGIIGVLFFIASVVFGFFFKFDSAIIVQIALASFGLCAILGGAIKTAKEKKIKVWQIIVVLVLSVAGGVLCCIGGYSDSIFQQISGVVVALIGLILGLVASKKS